MINTVDSSSGMSQGGGKSCTMYRGETLKLRVARNTAVRLVMRVVRYMVVEGGSENILVKSVFPTVLPHMFNARPSH